MWIKPSQESFDGHQNSLINLDLVVTCDTAQRAVENSVQTPSSFPYSYVIEFTFIGGGELRWSYPGTEEGKKLRDLDFKLITKDCIQAEIPEEELPESSEVQWSWIQQTSTFIGRNKAMGSDLFSVAVKEKTYAQLVDEAGRTIFAFNRGEGYGRTVDAKDACQHHLEVHYLGLSE